MYHVGTSCFTRVFCACVRIVWNGFFANSEFCNIIGIRLRSIALFNPSIRHSPASKDHNAAHKARFRCALLSGAALPSPIWPCVVRGRDAVASADSDSRASWMVCGTATSTADNAALMSSSPLATCSFARRFRRRSCDLEYGEDDASRPAWGGGTVSLR